MARKRKGRRAVPQKSREEQSLVLITSTTPEDVEVATLLSEGLACPAKVSKTSSNDCYPNKTTRMTATRHSSQPKKQTPEEKEALQVLTHGFPTTRIDSATKNNACEVTEEFQQQRSQLSSSLLCVSPDGDRMMNEELQKVTLDVQCSAEATVTTTSRDPSTCSALQEGLQILSSVFLISSNALIDQIKYLPDSIVPVADYSYDEHDEEKMDKQTDILRREFGHLLFDRETPRADFLALPPNVLKLLRGVWNLSEDPSVTDRVGKRLVPVQSFFPNLLNYLLRSPGFPTTSDVFDSAIFRSSEKKKVKATETEFKQVIRDTLENMGYPCDGQDIEFYLSFMKTKRRTIVQHPHIDFKFETVDPWYVDESPASRRRGGRGKRLGYRERVPFIAFFPLTPAGMAVEVWEARDDHRFGRPGVLVHIPYGCMMIARGDLVHAGGFSNSSEGNPRCHLYIYRSPGGEVHDINTSNSYLLDIDGKTMHMSQLYQHGPGI